MNARDIVPRRGRSTAEALTIEFVRPLTAADLVELGSTPAQKLGPPPLKKLGAIHQKAAQLVAAGHSDTEVALAVGRTPQRIRDLKVDPSFAELVAIYASEREERLADAQQRIDVGLINIAELSLDEITERLEDPARVAKMPTSELRQLLQMASDRTVAPPKVAQTQREAPTQITFNIAGRGLSPPQDSLTAVSAEGDHPKPEAAVIIDAESEDL